MIWREFCKYGRRFRGLILFYVCWIALNTFLTATHQAFVSDSAGIRRFAMEIEPHETLVGVALLVVFIAALWREDSIWEPKAFWKPRPISTRDQITAKVLWLVLLGGLIPAISGMLTTHTAQMGWAESWAFGTLQGLFYLALGSTVSGLVFVCKRWEEIGVNLVMHLPVILLHGYCWVVMGNDLPGWLVYLVLVVAGFGIVLVVSIRKARQVKSVKASLITMSVVGLLTALVHTNRNDLDRVEADLPAESIVELTVAGDHLALGPGIKAAIDAENPTAPKFRYWYQVNLLGTQPVNCMVREWAPGSSGGSGHRLRILPGKARVIGSLSLSGEEGSGASVNRTFPRTE